MISMAGWSRRDGSPTGCRCGEFVVEGRPPHRVFPGVAGHAPGGWNDVAG